MPNDGLPDAHEQGAAVTVRFPSEACGAAPTSADATANGDVPAT